MHNSFIVGILVVVVIGVVGWLAYSQGYFMGREENDAGLEINLGSSRGEDY